MSAVRTKAVVLLLMIHYFLLLQLFVGVLCLVLESSLNLSLPLVSEEQTIGVSIIPHRERETLFPYLHAYLAITKRDFFQNNFILRVVFRRNYTQLEARYTHFK